LKRKQNDSIEEKVGKKQKTENEIEIKKKICELGEDCPITNKQHLQHFEHPNSNNKKSKEEVKSNVSEKEKKKEVKIEKMESNSDEEKETKKAKNSHLKKSHSTRPRRWFGCFRCFGWVSLRPVFSASSRAGGAVDLHSEPRTRAARVAH